MKLVGSRRPVGKVGETQGVFPGLSIGDRACAVRRASAQPIVHKFTGLLRHCVTLPLPQPARSCRNTPRPASASRAPDGDAVGYRRRQQNAHVTERREVLYLWHPWFGLTVHIHQVVEKGLTGTLRCSVDGAGSGRWLELPAWMFDRAICLPITVASSPRAHLAALESLRKLLIELRLSPPVIIAAGSGAQRNSRHQNRRSADAQPASRFEKPTASSGPIQSVRQPTGRAAMASVAAGDSVGGDRAYGAVAERTPAIRAPVRCRRTER